MKGKRGERNVLLETERFTDEIINSNWIVVFLFVFFASLETNFSQQKRVIGGAWGWHHGSFQVVIEFAGTFCESFATLGLNGFRIIRVRKAVTSLPDRPLK